MSTTASGSGGGIVDKVRQRAAEELTTQKDRAFEGIGSVAQAVRQSTHQLRDQHHETLAGYVEQAADQIDRFAKQLREKDLTDLLDDAQRLARRQPSLFVGSAFALGLVGARFLKSSPRHSDDAHHSHNVQSRGRADSGAGHQGSSGPQYGGRSTVGTDRTTSGSGVSPVSTGSTPVGSGSTYASSSESSLTSSSAGTGTGGAASSGIGSGSTSGSTRARQGTQSDSPGTSPSRSQRPEQG